MPQVIIHKMLTNDRQRNGRLAEEVRRVVLDVLKVDKTFGQVIIYEAPMYDRSNHEQGNLNFVFVEITMAPGRTIQTKQQLVERIMETIEDIEEVQKEEINVAIREVKAENYISGKLINT